MKTTTETQTKKNATFSSIRVKAITKEKIDKKLSQLNKTDEYGKVNYDKLIQFLIDNVTKEQIEELQRSTVTWKIEEPRLIKLWAKKNGKVTSDRWKEMLYMGQLQDFIKKHSRITF